MIRTYTCNGTYKNQSYKITSANIGSKSEQEYGAVVEINGIKRHLRIGTHDTARENIQCAVAAIKRLIDRSELAVSS